MKRLLALGVAVASVGCLDFTGEVDRLCEAVNWPDCMPDAGSDAGSDGGSDAGAVDAGDGGDGGPADAGSDAGSDAGVDGGPSSCLGRARTRWCWELPLATANDVGAIWGDDTDLFVANSGGMLLHWDGGTWGDYSHLLPPVAPSDSGVPAFRGSVVDGVGTRLLYGQRTIALGWDGTAFTLLSGGNDFIAASATATETWFLPASGGELEARSLDGGVTPVTVPTLSGASRSDVFVDDATCLVATQSDVLQCNGVRTALSYVDGGGSPVLRRFIRTADGGLALGGSSGHLFFYADAGAWTPAAIPGPWQEFINAGAAFAGKTRIVGSSGFMGDFETGLERFKDQSSALTRVHVTPGGTFWAGGEGGRVLSATVPTVTLRDGPFSAPRRGTARGLFVGARVVAALATGLVVERTGERTWTQVMGVPAFKGWSSVWIDGQDVWLLEEHGEVYLGATLVFPGNGTAVPPSVSKFAQLRERGRVLWGATGDVVFAVALDGGAASSTSQLLDGGAYYASDLELNVGGVFVSVNEAINGVPDNGRVFFVNESTLAVTQVGPTETSAIYDLAVAADGGVWVASENGVRALAGGGNSLTGHWVGVHVDAFGTVWAVAPNGALARRTGTGWSVENPPWGGGANFHVTTLTSDATSLWLAGDHASVLRRPLP